MNEKDASIDQLLVNDSRRCDSTPLEVSEHLAEQTVETRSNERKTTTTDEKFHPSRWDEEEEEEKSSSTLINEIPKTSVKKDFQPNLDKIVVKEFLPRTSKDPNLPVLRELFIRSFDHFYREIESKLNITTGETLLEWLDKTFNNMRDEMLNKKCRCFLLCLPDQNDENIPSGVYGFLTLKEEENEPIYIAQCAINPIIKRKGYGSRLLQHLREVYPPGTNYVGLCRRANEPAIQFYLKLGAKFMESTEVAKKYHYDPELYIGFRFCDSTNVDPKPDEDEPVETKPLLERNPRKTEKTTKCCRIC